MHIDKKVSELKSKVITRIMLGVRGFNEKHRSLARGTTVLALILIVILSVLFTIAEKICSIFSGTGVFEKRALGIILAVVLLFVTSRAGIFIPSVVETIELDTLQSKEVEAAAEMTELVEETVAAEMARAESQSDTEVSVQEASVDSEPAKAETETVDAADSKTTEAEEIKAEQAENTPAETEQEEKAEEKQEESSATASTETTKSSAAKVWNTSDIDLASLIKEYPETVGWIYFEDGHISYPIMQSSDNTKYKKRDYKGEEVREGSIFLDYQSAPDFTDINSIIYGHNMKDGTMFGSFREYRNDPGYYKDHQYFQVILPDKRYRYLIFAYMDVPKSYVLYDYVGEASKGLLENLDAVRAKAYIGDDVPVKDSDKVVTLSTCTDKDSLQFVILGVMVDETE